MVLGNISIAFLSYWTKSDLYLILEHLKNWTEYKRIELRTSFYKFPSHSQYFAVLIFMNHQAGIKKFVEFIFAEADQIHNKSCKNLFENDEYT